MKLAARALSFLYTCARSLSVALYICRSPFAVVVAIACECLCGPRGEPYEEPNLSYEPSAPRPRNWTGAALGYSCQHRKQIPIALWAGIPKKVDLKAERASEADKRVTRNTPPAASLSGSLALSLTFSQAANLPNSPKKKIPLTLASRSSSSHSRPPLHLLLYARRRPVNSVQDVVQGFPPPSTRSSLTALDVDESQRIPTTTPPCTRTYDAFRSRICIYPNRLRLTTASR